MSIYTKVLKRVYQDSLKLMRVSSEIKSKYELEQAFAFMGTEINKKTRIPESMLSQEVSSAGADDLILLVKSDNVPSANEVLKEFEAIILENVMTGKDNIEKEVLPVTFEEGASSISEPNLAIISVPGTYAAMQAMSALRLGMNVQLFSDNVTIEEEIALKDYAKAKGLLVMGPDCGTSIISGVPICFANKVRQGNIGVIGASGTGTQEFTVLIDAMGLGISHAIGTGGRDLSEAVEARTTIAAIELLANDPQTEIICVISKPPAKNAEEKVIEAIKKANKPTVLAFMGRDSACISSTPMIYMASTIEESVAKVVALAKSEDASKADILYDRAPLNPSIITEMDHLLPSQKYVRGLFTGGTLASEAVFTLQKKNISVYSNISKSKEFLLQPALKSQKNSIVDLGDDEFTRGSVHPMIDPSRRSEHITSELADPETAVLLCDVVIGYGSHPDPAGVLARDVRDAKSKTGSTVIVIASVIGTDSDPQQRYKQLKKLEDAGIWVYPTNQYAAEVAGQIIDHITK